MYSIPSDANCAAVALEHQVFDLLVYLVRNLGRVVSKARVMASVAVRLRTPPPGSANSAKLA